MYTEYGQLGYWKQVRRERAWAHQWLLESQLVEQMHSNSLGAILT